MSTEFRQTGISVVGDLPWVTHFCLFYETNRDLLDALVPYFKAGLERNEFCLWVISEPLTAEEARSTLEQAVPDLDQYLAAGSIEIIQHDEWYLKGGFFDLGQVIESWTEKRVQALDKGYTGMRVSGNTSWINEKDWRDFREYEKELNVAVANERLIVLCTYPLASSGAAEILDVAQIHEFAVARRQGKWDIVETPELKEAKEEIGRLNEELEQRVAERTRELEEVNEELRKEIIERKQVEAELRQQKEILEKIFDHIPVMIRFFGREGHVMLANREWEQTLGWSLEEIERQNLDIFAECYPDPQDHREVLEFIAAATGEWVDVKTRVRDGRVLDTSWANVRLSDGASIGFGIDITERKNVENELRRQKEILQTIFDRIPVMITLLSEDGRIKLVNREWERVLGWSLEEAVEEGAHILSEAYPDPQLRQKALNLVSSSQGEWADFKTRVRDGRVIDTSWAVVHLSDGTAIVFGIDITERKQSERAEREQRARAEALSDTTATLNSTLDFEEVLQRILDNAGRVVPHDTSVIQLIDGGDLRVARHRGFAERGLSQWVEGFRVPIDQHPGFRRQLETGAPLVLSDVQADMDWHLAPALRWVRSYIAAPIRIKAEIIGTINLHSAIPDYFTPSNAIDLQAFADQAAIALEHARLLRDVQTARERLQTLSEQLLVAQEAERRSIARELHDEIGQVLTAVGANLKVIELSPDRATRAERLTEGLNLVDNALKQVRDLALDLRPSLLDDFGLVPALEYFIERQAQRSGFSAEFVTNLSEIRFSPGLETTCFRVAQIALTNVARHAQAKQALIELRWRGTELELTIRDDGVGFDVQTALERALHGATLGLLSMQERVRLAGGELYIKSAPGQGTEIRARFPIE